MFAFLPSLTLEQHGTFYHLWHNNKVMERRTKQERVHVGPQGRIVIPAHLRRALGVDRGDTLLARVEDGRMVLEKRETVLARVKRRFEKVPRGVSLADELISERREEARRESAKS